MNAPQTSSFSSVDKAILCAHVAFDKKAENIRIYDLREQPSFTDFFVICSAHSDRQVEAIAGAIITKLKQSHLPPLHAEGLEDSKWVLVDAADVVVHVFIDAFRDYYDLDGLWARAPRLSLPDSIFAPAASSSSQSAQT